MTIVSAAMLAVRLSRKGRLRRVERRIAKLSGDLSLAPSLSRPADAGRAALLRW